jgi:sulfate/thiosulfate transport system ATP-binding protein
MSVRVEGLSKAFARSGAPAVFEAGFEAPVGGITTLLGPSGSGKTTILRIIAGLERPDAGRVLVDGQDITRVPVQKRGFGFVFQGFALFGHMTVAENIAFGLRVRRASSQDIRERVAELLKLVQLEGHGDRYPAQLSGGQRQRVGFARALAPRPKLLLLDEPFGALDTRVRIELREWLRQLHDVTHLTTILVTHDQEEALDLSDQIVVMDGGRIEQVGSPETIYEAPATPFVASFIGSANVLRGQVQAGRASIGALSLKVPAHIPDGALVRAIVRPHDIRILAVQTGIVAAADTTPATVQRVVSLGAHVKLELGLPNRDVVTVHVPRREFAAMGLEPGELVLLDLNKARVFEEDYVI